MTVRDAEMSLEGKFDDERTQRSVSRVRQDDRNRGWAELMGKALAEARFASSFAGRYEIKKLAESPYFRFLLGRRVRGGWFHRISHGQKLSQTIRNDTSQAFAGGVLGEARSCTCCNSHCSTGEPAYAFLGRPLQY